MYQGNISLLKSEALGVVHAITGVLIPQGGEGCGSYYGSGCNQTVWPH